MISTTGRSPAIAAPTPAPAYAGPPAPLPPRLVARDEEGRITIRAIPLTTPLRIDGQLDEAAYDGLEPISDFIQMEPNGGQPASERTEVWLFFDADNVYVTVRAWESQPPFSARERRMSRARWTCSVMFARWK